MQCDHAPGMLPCSRTSWRNHNLEPVSPQRCFSVHVCLVPVLGWQNATLIDQILPENFVRLRSSYNFVCEDWCWIWPA
jgi:hypothetical protein